MSAISSIDLPSPSAGQSRIVIIGAGIVGSCIARALSTTSSSQVILLDRDIGGLPGSTTPAPGFVGQFNELPVLTELARRSVHHYCSIDGGFDVVGGLEVAETPIGEDNLKRRCQLAEQAGLPARLISVDEALSLAPQFIKADEVRAALFFESDGTANAPLITRTEQSLAKNHGAILINAHVQDFQFDSTGKIQGITTDRGLILTDKVILCTGIWTPQLAGHLPVFPVTHPYSFAAARSSVRPFKSPFIRWPESHVYARDHGLRDGIGCYDHIPILTDPSSLSQSAYGTWVESFTQVLERAGHKLPQETLNRFHFNNPTREYVFNGLFSITPDGLPFVGELWKGRGVWCAVAVWITHAAGSAHLLADMVEGRLKQEDEPLVEALNPNRFEGMDLELLKEEAAKKYNDIYNKNR